MKKKFDVIGYCNNDAKNSRDIIIVNNALDHCINPFKSIIEMLHVLKPGGKLYMNHHRAEGGNGGYTGLHQWNLDLSSKKEFIIWNYNNAINVTEAVSDFATVKVVYNDTDERVNQSLITIIEKTKDFDLWNYASKESEIQDLAKLSQKLLEFICDGDVNSLFHGWLTE